MNFLNWFTLIFGVAGLSLACYAFLEVHNQERALAYTAGVIAALLLITAFVSAIIPLTPQNTASSASNTPTALTGIIRTPVNTISPTAGNTPLPTSTDTPIPSPTPSPTPIPTQSPAPKPGDILFTAKFDGSQPWSGDSSWRIYGNALHCSGQGIVHIPYRVQTVQGQATNYTVRFKATAENDGNFGVDVRIADDGSGGYKIGPNGSDMNELYHLIINTGSNTYSTQFDPGLSSHTYEITVANDSIAVKVDGSPLLQAVDGTYPTGGNITLYSYVPLYITSFVVIQA